MIDGTRSTNDTIIDATTKVAIGDENPTVNAITNRATASASSEIAEPVGEQRPLRDLCPTGAHGVGGQAWSSSEARGEEAVDVLVEEVERDQERDDADGDADEPAAGRRRRSTWAPIAMAATTNAQSTTWGIAERSWNQPSEKASAAGAGIVGSACRDGSRDRARRDRSGRRGRCDGRDRRGRRDDRRRSSRWRSSSASRPRRTLTGADSSATSRLWTMIRWRASTTSDGTTSTSARRCRGWWSRPHRCRWVRRSRCRSPRRRSDRRGW